MNIADNSFRAAWIKPIRPYSHAEQVSGPDAAKRMPFPKEFPETNEAFVFTIPETGLDTSTDYGYFNFYPPSITPIDPNTVILWGCDLNKRFTGCDPNATGDDLGFEYIATSSFVYYRNPDGTIATPHAQHPGLWSWFETLNNRRNSDPYGTHVAGSCNGSGSGKVEFYIGFSGGGLNETVALPDEPTVTGSPLGLRMAWGMGSPPAVPPGGVLNINNCFRPRIVCARNDL